MINKRDLLFLAEFSILGIVFYLLPFTHQNVLGLLVILLVLGIAAMGLAVQRHSRKDANMRWLSPAVYVLIFFLPIITTEWIYFKYQGEVTIFGMMVDSYSHYSFLPLFAGLLIVSLGIAGAWWQWVIKESRR
jgi:hypothetical protein